ncbi:PREDICTED: E3 UFM1-protein ligase 1 homolog [Acropora digitifera]|uniref:E3 UFM1-protein ligase 1 homolog n=1 Tax=Acropora digitifera TaxID=70779 RepID=UPI00077A4499|nr:PREDICTED: E3 UFM1-protein ligase 1 homolog [Acropora digitifera]
MADWEEIKRLAADFQRAQLSSTAHKLSERNCVEIVQKLIHLGLIEVIYTTDGKEYLTPQQLEREIKDELFVHGGRINVVDLQQLIGVDFSHVEKKVIEMVKHSSSLKLIQGDLIDKNYLDQVAEDINDFLQESGQISIAELSKKFTFPTDFLLEIIESHLGTVIHGQLDMLDRGVLFTESFVAQQTACIRGVFSAITKPTTLSSLIAEYGFHEKLLYGKLVACCNEGVMKEKGVPLLRSIWTSLVMLTCAEELKRIPYHFYLTACVCSEFEVLAYASRCFSLQPLLPSPCTSGDAARLLQDIFKSSVHSLAHVFCESIAVSDRFLQNCKDPFQQLMQDKAKTDSLTAPALFSELKMKDLAAMGVAGGGGSDKRESKKEERRKKAAGGGSKGGGGGGSGGGGGRGGRESKTQKMMSRNQNRTKVNCLLCPLKRYQKSYKKRCPSCSDDLIEEIANYLYRPLTQSYQEVARSVFLSTGDKQRKSHSEVQSKVNVLWANAKLFDKGIKLFTDDVQVQLSRHLLKTVCADIVNLAVSLLAAEHMITIKDDSAITPEVLTMLLYFFSCRQLSLERRCALQEQLRQENDPAMALHLVSAVLFQHHTGCMLHAPGRCVPQIISFLEDKLSPEHYASLNQYVTLVIKQLSGSEDHESTEGQEGKSVTDQLEEGLDNIKKLALELKKAKDTDS